MQPFILRARQNLPTMKESIRTSQQHWAKCWNQYPYITWNAFQTPKQHGFHMIQFLPDRINLNNENSSKRHIFRPS